MISYVDDTSVFCHPPNPSTSNLVVTQLRSDIFIYSWCQQRSMKSNYSKTNTVIFSCSKTLNPQLPSILINNEVIS